VGLVMANAPAMSSSRVKAHVVNSAEYLPGLLGGLIKTEGRANAANALLPMPMGVNASKQGKSSVNITWTDTPSESGYVVERKRPGESFFSTLTNLAQNTTSYKDTGLDFVGTYSYRVRTRSGTNRSAYSATVSVSKPGEGSSFPCFIATAAWGRPDAPEVMALRRFRDNVLMKNAAGRRFVALYNLASPPLARRIAERPAARLAVRTALRPAVYLGITHPFMGLGLMTAAFIIIAGVTRTTKISLRAKRRRRDK
ncbi:hypothetical protein LCGC14_1363330, partial [marine sediment metagenome]